MNQMNNHGVTNQLCLSLWNKISLKIYLLFKQFVILLVYIDESYFWYDPR